jgi:hypothetical protein
MAITVPVMDATTAVTMHLNGRLGLKFSWTLRGWRNQLDQLLTIRHTYASDRAAGDPLVPNSAIRGVVTHVREPGASNTATQGLLQTEGTGWPCHRNPDCGAGISSGSYQPTCNQLIIATYLSTLTNSKRDRAGQLCRYRWQSCAHERDAGWRGSSCAGRRGAPELPPVHFTAQHSGEVCLLRTG